MAKLTLEEKEAEVKRLQEEIKEEKYSNCKHKWSDWEAYPYGDSQYRDCSKCGKTEWR